jgi:hypothetical protein
MYDDGSKKCIDIVVQGPRKSMEELVKQELDVLVKYWKDYLEPYYDDKYKQEAYRKYMKYCCNNNPYNLIKKYGYF